MKRAAIRKTRPNSSIGGDRAGFVYVLSNPAMPGVVKIGRTVRDPLTRLAELNSATGVPIPFRIEGAVASKDVVAAETQIHARLAGKRVNKKREFFRCTVEEAVGLTRIAALNPQSTFIDRAKFARRLKAGRGYARPPLFGGSVISIACWSWINVYNPLLGLGWLLMCFFCLLSGQPRILAEFLGLARHGNVPVLVSLTVAGLLPFVLGWANFVAVRSSLELFLTFITP